MMASQSEAMLRGIILFLAGAGFAAGIFMTGTAERIGHAFGGTGFSSAPLVLRVGSSLRCSPQYAVFNRSDNAVYFALPGAREDIVKIPPGASLAPSGLVQPIIAAGAQAADVEAVSLASDEACPAIRIELG